MPKKIPKAFKWKARIKGYKQWHYFANKDSAKRWLDKYGGGNLRKRQIRDKNEVL